MTNNNHTEKRNTAALDESLKLAKLTLKILTAKAREIQQTTAGILSSQDYSSVTIAMFKPSPVDKADACRQRLEVILPFYADLVKTLEAQTALIRSDLSILQKFTYQSGHAADENKNPADVSCLELAVKIARTALKSQSDPVAAISLYYSYLLEMKTLNADPITQIGFFKSLSAERDIKRIRRSDGIYYLLKKGGAA